MIIDTSTTKKVIGGHKPRPATYFYIPQPAHTPQPFPLTHEAASSGTSNPCQDSTGRLTWRRGRRRPDPRRQYDIMPPHCQTLEQLCRLLSVLSSHLRGLYWREVSSCRYRTTSQSSKYQRPRTPKDTIPSYRLIRPAPSYASQSSSTGTLSAVTGKITMDKKTHKCTSATTATILSDRRGKTHGMHLGLKSLLVLRAPVEQRQNVWVAATDASPSNCGEPSATQNLLPQHDDERDGATIQLYPEVVVVGPGEVPVDGWVVSVTRVVRYMGRQQCSQVHTNETQELAKKGIGTSPTYYSAHDMSMFDFYDRAVPRALQSMSWNDAYHLPDLEATSRRERKISTVTDSGQDTQHVSYRRSHRVPTRLSGTEEGACHPCTLATPWPPGAPLDDATTDAMDLLYLAGHNCQYKVLCFTKEMYSSHRNCQMLRQRHPSQSRPANTSPLLIGDRSIAHIQKHYSGTLWGVGLNSRRLFVPYQLPHPVTLLIPHAVPMRMEIYAFANVGVPLHPDNRRCHADAGAADPACCVRLNPLFGHTQQVYRISRRILKRHQGADTESQGCRISLPRDTCRGMLLEAGTRTRLYGEVFGAGCAEMEGQASKEKFTAGIKKHIPIPTLPAPIARHASSCGLAPSRRPVLRQFRPERRAMDASRDIGASRPSTSSFDKLKKLAP
ncbi:hypothetical protein QBC46DRAFT_450958 [Diplogelasinospora grovesii]|uniref:Uncharacterized protein n=1 Tax=Diplogelasinospora grovesii TaxID=303347 RepID=A0AAN6N402_9PEZI|nr:hypothetical protein QBC46DRAFT_450958 [Diplogelasinospora grovesii]